MKIDKILDDYATRRVPKDKRKSLAHLSAVLFGATVAIPVFMLSQTIVTKLAFNNAIFAVIIGCFISGILSSITAYIGAKTNLSLAMICKITFGELGGRLISGVLGLVILAWFGITVDFFGTGLGEILNNNFGLDISLVAITIVSGLLMMTTGIIGFKAIDKISVIFAPIMIAIMGVMLYKVFALDDSMGRLYMETDNSMTITGVISMLVGIFASGLIDPPDITRFAKNAKTGVLSYMICLWGMIPLFIVITMILLKIAGQSDFAPLIAHLNMGVLGIIFLFTAVWTSNDNNLYSSALNISPILKNTPKWKIATILGLLGILLGVSKIFSYFIPILETMGVVIVPIAGVIIADFFFVNKEKYLKDGLKTKNINITAFVCWIIAVIVGLLMNGNTEVKSAFSLTTVPAIDCVLLSFVLYLIISKIKTKRKHSNENR
ncbi:MAG: hypothetical protein GY793_07695 [Proteobacteria bacterium]|nr:hypothetical protein [Pseudomonadota bacterium]